MISIEELQSLRPGDKIKIVDAWECDRHDDYGEMDEYLGTFATVAYVHNVHCSILEDGQEWSWFRTMIDFICPVSDSEFESATAEELAALLR